jgi:hypothetical protein
MNNTLTEQDHQLLSQFVDGELPPQASRDLEQRLASEPALSARLATLNALDHRLKNAFAGPQLESVPGHITDLISPPPARILPWRQRRSSSWGYAIAASLAIAVCGTLVTQWGRDPGQADTGMEHYSLAQALEQLPSSGSDWSPLADGSKIRPVLSFRSHSGDWCREYLVADSVTTWHGVACRAQQGWSTAVIAETALAIGPGEYRPAGANEADSVAAFVDQQSADIPLDAEQEAVLIGHSWQ